MDYRKLYREYYGEYPEGCIIHHIDHDRKNNDVSNLVCLTDRLHRRYHAVCHSLGTCEPFNISPDKALHLFSGAAFESVKKYLDYLYRIACLKVGQKQLAELKDLDVNEWHYNEIRRSVRYE